MGFTSDCVNDGVVRLCECLLVGFTSDRLGDGVATQRTFLLVEFTGEWEELLTPELLSEK